MALLKSNHQLHKISFLNSGKALLRANCFVWINVIMTGTIGRDLLLHQKVCAVLQQNGYAITSGRVEIDFKVH